MDLVFNDQSISTDDVIYIFRSLKKTAYQKGKTKRKIKNNESFILVTDLVPEIAFTKTE